MAIDSAAKRRAAAGVPCHPLGPGVTPDAAKPASWRKQSAWGYAGGVVVQPMGRQFLITGRGDKFSTAIGRGDKPTQAPGAGTKGFSITGEGG